MFKRFLFGGFYHTQNSPLRSGIRGACYDPSSVPWVPKLYPAREEAMQWYHFVAYLFGGAFFVNAIPHFINGVSGRPFPTPFASPPGKGLSPAFVNVLWGSLNLVVGYVLVFRVGTFDFRRTQDALIVGVGGLLMAVMLSRTFAGIGKEGGK